MPHHKSHHSHHSTGHQYPVLLPRPMSGPVLLPRPTSPVLLPRPMSGPVFLPEPITRPNSPVLLPGYIPGRVVLQRRRPKQFFINSGLISLLKDNLEDIVNIRIIFVNSNKVLLIKDKLSDEWMIPSGKRYPDESFKDAVHRIFKNITGFDIKTDIIDYNPDTTNSPRPRINRDMELSMVYKIESNQDDKFASRNKLIYIPIDDLRNLINDGISYDDVDSLAISTKSLLNDTFFK